ncbi:MAG: GntR family transcriptional regulator [Desulfobacteraceae bacterium]|jgi:DNA-binding GntR family transcriptional regulator
MVVKKETFTYTDEAFRSIKQLILNQEVVPGQKLIYDDLAKRLKMSRTPVINALNRLEQLGLVVSESNRGYTVKPMETAEAWETFDFREAIEIYAVEQVILKSNGSDMDALEEKLLAYEDYKPNYYDRKKIFLDAGFHLQIAEMTGNSVLKWHLKLDLQHLYLRTNLNNYNLDREKKATAEHRQLFRKIKDKDVMGAVELMKHHIRRDKEYTIACLAEDKLAGEGIDF